MKDTIRYLSLIFLPIVGLLLTACGQVVTPTLLETQTHPTQTERAHETETHPTQTEPVMEIESKANADVIFVRAVESADGTWTFHVTVSHPDTGWDDYADGWDVLTLDGEVIKPDPDSPFTRLLTHPHESEQPFTRSQSRIAIPSGLNQVQVRAHDLVDGFGGRVVIVDLTLESGEDFSVERSP
jgi:hypothetical protein